MKSLFAPILLLAALAGAPASAAEADPPGKALFESCAVCHSLAPGDNEIGPGLKGVFGRKAGSVEGFPYSNAMKRSDVVWSAQSLDRFLADPQATIPGNRMPFSGMEAAADRAALIAYLQSATQ